jgi:predicted nucleotidyltransferase
MRPDLTCCHPALLHLPDRVVDALLQKSRDLTADRIMLVGARCRDVIHSSLGHEEGLALTSDLDIGLVISDLDDYEEIVRPLDPAGGTGIRYMLGGVPTDLMPFGEVEDPVGTVTPEGRGESLSVWAFREVFAGSMPLALPSGSQIRIPTVEGYAALKLAAWLDRHPYFEFKDARDLATCVFWYSESSAIESRLYTTESGIQALIEYDMDVRKAAAHMLGVDIAAHIGERRVDELKQRWPGSRDDLISEFKVEIDSAGWPRGAERRDEVLVALESGWRTREVGDGGP